MRVLIVDDDPQICLLAADVLVEHEVSLAQDGTAAEALIETIRFDCILLDVMMPGMSGFEVLARVRGDAANDRTAVVMMTAKAGDHDFVEAYRTGADAYVTKPFDIDELRDIVQRMGMLRPSERAALRRSELARAELLASIEETFEQ